MNLLLAHQFHAFWILFPIPEVPAVPEMLGGSREGVAAVVDHEMCKELKMKIMEDFAHHSVVSKGKMLPGLFNSSRHKGMMSGGT
jgi:hypothetical protein